MDPLDHLREMYETRLKKGPFPNADCSAAGLTDREHGIVTMFLADVAGIASHGRKLAFVPKERKTKFRDFVARSFEERWPDTCAKITSERAPALFNRMKDTDEARLLIKRYLAGELH